jgi:sensor histidine kinase YesM
MMSKGPYITKAVSVEGKNRSKRFWKRAFIIYAAAEVFLIATGYWVTGVKCPVCVLPVVYYVFFWLQHLFFTGLLWYCLNRFYHLRPWQQALLNVILFLTWYFFWLGTRYGIFHSGLDWLTGEKTNIGVLRDYVYSSWTDIGKYVVILSAYYVLKFYLEFRKAERQRVELAVINKEMQLNLLKQQLSPHFYFNTLNNLYGLARNNSVRLSAALQQLHNIMQYVMNDCNEPRVLLWQEISFLESYIALEKLRYEHDTVIDMEVAGDAQQFAILPLLLIQFVENAFKHGMKEKSADNWMHVKMNIMQPVLEFSVQNSYYGTGGQPGIGLESVRRLLALQYEGRHSIEISHGADCFSVNLKLQLL